MVVLMKKSHTCSCSHSCGDDNMSLWIGMCVGMCASCLNVRVCWKCVSLQPAVTVGVSLSHVSIPSSIQAACQSVNPAPVISASLQQSSQLQICVAHTRKHTTAHINTHAVYTLQNWEYILLFTQGQPAITHTQKKAQGEHEQLFYTAFTQTHTKSCAYT